MANFEIKGNTIISESCNNVHTFELVDKIPSNFFVWNIGKNMGHDEYIPLCEDLHPENKECYEINTSTLKAIKLPSEEVQLLREAAHNGITSLIEAETAIKSKRRGYWCDRKREHATKTIDIFRRISKQ